MERSSKRDNKNRARGSVMEIQLDSGVRKNVITILRNLGPFAKPEHREF